MFYLKLLSGIMLARPIQVLLSFFCLGLFFIALSGESPILQFWQKGPDEEMLRPHFFALIPKDVDQAKLQGRLMTLPGISRVPVQREESLKRKTAALLKTMGLGNLNSELAGNFFSLKVVMEESISEKSIQLIREYLSRLVGTDKIVLGPTQKRVLEVSAESSWLLSIKKWSLRGLALFFLLGWFMAIWPLHKALRRKSWLVQKYQRRSNVFNKLGSLFALLSVLGVGVPFVFIGHLDTHRLLLAMTLVFFLGAGLSLRSTKWENS